VPVGINTRFLGGSPTQVTTRITAKGLRLVEDLDEPLKEAHAGQLGHMNKAELRTLIALLDKARSTTD